VTNLVSFYCIIPREYDAVNFGERDNNASF